MLANRYYVLDECNIPVEALDILEWCNALNSLIAYTTLANGATVSTIFTGLNCICPKIPPVVFETCVLKDGQIGVTRRYRTWDEALLGHKKECRRLRGTGGDDMTSNYYYILGGQDGHTPVEVTDIFEWGMWFETAGRVVARTTITEEVEVSTVFLGLNHSLFSPGPPMLFETLVFGGESDGDMRRYATWEEAEAGHKEECARCHLEWIEPFRASFQQLAEKLD